MQLIKLGKIWGNEPKTAFENLESDLASATSLAFPRDDHVLCMFTDASDIFRGAILTQCAKEDMRDPATEWNYETLSFHSATCKGSSINWSV